MSFKEFLSQLSLLKAGEKYVDNRSNIDVAYGLMGTRSKEMYKTLHRTRKEQWSLIQTRIFRHISKDASSEAKMSLH
jgi:hypothetical protein